MDINNKYSIIGSFTNDIVVPHFPSQLKFALYIEFIFPKSGRNEFDLRFIVDDQQIITVSIQAEVSERQSVSPFAFPGFDLGLPKPSTLRIDIGLKGKWSPLIRKEIQEGTVTQNVIFRNSTAAPPPS